MKLVFLLAFKMIFEDAFGVGISSSLSYANVIGRLNRVTYLYCQGQRFLLS